MPEQFPTREPTAAGEVVAGVLTVLVLGNGLVSALIGNWWPTIVALALIVFASWYCSPDD